MTDVDRHDTDGSSADTGGNAAHMPKAAYAEYLEAGTTKLNLRVVGCFGIPGVLWGLGAANAEILGQC